MDWLLDAPGRDRGRAGPAAPGPGGQPRPDGAVRPVLVLDGGLALPAGRARLLPRRQEGQTADRVRAAYRPGRTPGRGAGLLRQHRRPGRLRRRGGDRAGEVRAGRAGAGRRPRHDYLGADRGAARAGRHRLADRAARPADRRAGRRGRAAAADPVRPAGPGRDHPPRLPRRAADRGHVDRDGVVQRVRNASARNAAASRTTTSTTTALANLSRARPRAEREGVAGSSCSGRSNRPGCVVHRPGFWQPTTLRRARAGSSGPPDTVRPIPSGRGVDVGRSAPGAP